MSEPPRTVHAPLGWPSIRRDNADADLAMSEVEAGAMPPGGGLSSADRTQIINWASCDTPQ